MTVRYTNLGGSNYNSEEVSDADLNDTHNRIAEDVALVGEVKMFALSETGSITKASLQSRNWGICDGSTSLSQGITSATILVTPDLQNKFIRMSDDETSGTTGGSENHDHTLPRDGWGNGTNAIGRISTGITGQAGADNDNTSSSESNLPPFYEMAFFIKVK